MIVRDVDGGCGGSCCGDAVAVVGSTGGTVADRGRLLGEHSCWHGSSLAIRCFSS